MFEYQDPQRIGGESFPITPVCLRLEMTGVNPLLQVGLLYHRRSIVAHGRGGWNARPHSLGRIASNSFVQSDPRSTLVSSADWQLANLAAASTREITTVPRFALLKQLRREFVQI